MKIVKLTLSLLLAVSLVACGGEEKKEEKKESKVSIGSQTEQRETSTQDNEDAMDGVVQLTLEGSDQMKFNKKTLKAKAGSEVELTLKHVGEMSKQAMGHNFVLLNKGVDMMEFGERAAGASDNGYIPTDAGDDVIAHTEMIGGGESATVTFIAPEKGEYDFICSFPGHVALMKGKFIVE